MKQTKQRSRVKRPAPVIKSQIAKGYKWTVEFIVDPTLVAAGFNLTDERAHDMLVSALPYAFNCELEARVLTAPDEGRIRKEQGY